MPKPQFDELQVELDTLQHDHDKTEGQLSELMRQLKREHKVKTVAEATALIVCHGGVIVTIEDHLAVRDGRIPNLHGRVLQGSGGGGLVAGERLALIPTELSTGGGRGRT